MVSPGQNTPESEEERFSSRLPGIFRAAQGVEAFLNHSNGHCGPSEPGEGTCKVTLRDITDESPSVQGRTESECEPCSLALVRVSMDLREPVSPTSMRAAERALLKKRGGFPDDLAYGQPENRERVSWSWRAPPPWTHKHGSQSESSSDGGRALLGQRGSFDVFAGSLGSASSGGSSPRAFQRCPSSRASCEVRRPVPSMRGDSDTGQFMLQDRRAYVRTSTFRQRRLTDSEAVMNLGQGPAAVDQRLQDVAQELGLSLSISGPCTPRVGERVSSQGQTPVHQSLCSSPRDHHPTIKLRKLRSNRTHFYDEPMPIQPAAPCLNSAKMRVLKTRSLRTMRTMPANPEVESLRSNSATLYTAPAQIGSAAMGSAPQSRTLGKPRLPTAAGVTAVALASAACRAHDWATPL
eukprot:CAMPEP_0177597848 /NCGR_PEP_ID=MMETSP0419_2-20121207/11963_1 /TAXON_ID=582737 /ORGANISM="Tetraselmis sp., Strain GSL018" /LENGTH=407 /DNA_ID=CAMNT_0019090111 /DNA_START=114 /DNA_END=1338 /DNA_ORIENTATION=+